MNFTIENATVTATLDGLRYVNDFVTNITLTDPRENQMSISPQGGNQGVTYRVNTTQSVTGDFVLRNLPPELVELYKQAFADQSRIDFMIVDTRTNERYDMNDSIVRTNPINTTITEGEGSLDIGLNIACPPSEFSHKVGTI
jgi:hypothetical protein